MAGVGRRTLEASERDGLAAAALTFMAGVSGGAAVEALSPAARERIGRAGTGALAEATLLGMDPHGLAAISCPTMIATGEASQRIYVDIADALAEHIRGAVHDHIPGIDHMAPIMQPDVIAAAIDAFADR
jgi:pimeloyl-ACP methyl ester carboxylesterase